MNVEPAGPIIGEIDGGGNPGDPAFRFPDRRLYHSEIAAYATALLVLKAFIVGIVGDAIGVVGKLKREKAALLEGAKHMANLPFKVGIAHVLCDKVGNCKVKAARRKVGRVEPPPFDRSFYPFQGCACDVQGVDSASYLSQLPNVLAASNADLQNAFPPVHPIYNIHGLPERRAAVVGNKERARRVVADLPPLFNCLHQSILPSHGAMSRLRRYDEKEIRTRGQAVWMPLSGTTLMPLLQNGTPE